MPESQQLISRRDLIQGFSFEGLQRIEDIVRDARIRSGSVQSFVASINERCGKRVVTPSDISRLSNISSGEHSIKLLNKLIYIAPFTLYLPEELIEIAKGNLIPARREVEAEAPDTFRSNPAAIGIEFRDGIVGGHTPDDNRLAISLKFEQSKGYDMEKLKELVEAEINRRGISPEEFAKQVRINDKVLKQILNCEEPPNLDTKIVVLWRHLIDPRTGEKFPSDAAIKEYCGLKQNNPSAREGQDDRVNNHH